MIEGKALRTVLMVAAVLLTGSTAMGQGPTIGGSVYGGGALANTGNTTVNLTGGTIEKNVYGGGMGRLAAAAVGTEGAEGYVAAVTAVAPTVGTATVNLNHNVENTSRGCVVGGTIYGCNNLNGTPLGNVTVHVYKTQNAAATQIANTAAAEADGDTPAVSAVENAKVRNRYDVTAVYGGGNLAAYIPTDESLSSTVKANVIIEGCDLTSIKAVYGGGNAASAPATQVDVYGCYEIGEVFGGGNGFGADNPGANVGYYTFADSPDHSTKDNRLANYAYGAGTAAANIYGGTVHSVFGGSNTKGNIRVSSSVTLDEKDTHSEGCSIEAGELFGAGRSAEQDGSSNITLGCISGMEELYGGAYNANIGSDIVLTVTGGTIGRVFGGNNQGGTIGGTITVNVEETQCQPLIIGQVFGGGNQAPYTAPAGQHGPTVNMKSFTSVGEVFGGGLGSLATVTGDTYIYIDECKGRHSDTATYNGDTMTFTDGEEGSETTTTVTLPAFTAKGIGAIGTVYGGGDEANVDGNTYVYVGTRVGADGYIDITLKTGASVTGYYTLSEGVYSEATGTAVEGTTYYKKIEGVNITGNVFGGGNNAEVTGDTNVVIGKSL